MDHQSVQLVPHPGFERQQTQTWQPSIDAVNLICQHSPHGALTQTECFPERHEITRTVVALRPRTYSHGH